MQLLQARHPRSGHTPHLTLGTYIEGTLHSSQYRIQAEETSMEHRHKHTYPWDKHTIVPTTYPREKQTHMRYSSHATTYSSSSTTISSFGIAHSFI